MFDDIFVGIVEVVIYGVSCCFCFGGFFVLYDGWMIKIVDKRRACFYKKRLRVMITCIHGE